MTLLDVIPLAATIKTKSAVSLNAFAVVVCRVLKKKNE